MKPLLEENIAAAAKELFSVSINVELTRPEEEFGDYATNVALQLSKQVGKNPREIAETLAVKLRETLTERIGEVSVAGPGFINLKLNDQSLLDSLKVAPARSLAGKTVVAEYSDPNPFKVLHAGHLYTSIVGDAIANLLEQAGAGVRRVNFGGDVGLHVAKAMWGLRKAENINSVLNDPDFREGWIISQGYVKGNQAYETDEQAKSEINELNKQIYKLHQDNDQTSPLARLYWTCRKWSYDYFKYFYDSIGVKPFDRYYPESETAPLGIDKVKELLTRNVLQTSNGAIVFKGEEHGLHTRVFLTKESLPTYETKDLGLILKKDQDFHFDKSIVITGNDIIEYMKVVLKVVEQFAPELASATTHLTHGMVKLQGGKKMSSREGNVLQAVDIIISAATAARKTHQLADDLIEKQVVHGAVKYAFLKQRLGGDIIYDPAESVSLEGNSGPYLQYAHARARSILRKADTVSEIAENLDLETGERSLARKITEYPEVVDKAVNELMPHHIATYLYELAQTFNRFYENNRVIGDKRQALRAGLVGKYAETLKDGLNLLGIVAPEKM
jgi:arginyl-tRNA synthetase